MLIVCPNCATSYDLNPAALGPAGRNVRCVRCRETWHARVEDMVEAEQVAEPVEAAAGPAGPPPQAAAPQAEASFAEEPALATPHIESPPLASDVPPIDVDYEARPAAADPASEGTASPDTRGKRLRKGFAFRSGATMASRLRFSPPIVIAALAALCLALVIWRQDVVRLMPQTATFFKMIGLNVNLRNLDFEGVKISWETVNGNRVIVIEGQVTAGAARKPTEIPRLRFVVQDEQGADIYAWNAVLDQAVIQPGGRVPFRSRLASPPADARNIVVRFFHRRDLAAGSV